MSLQGTDERLHALAEWTASAGVAAGLTNYATADAVFHHAIAPIWPILSRLVSPDVSIAEIGPGSGVLGLGLALARPDATVTLVDASARSATYIEMTARRLRIPNVRVFRARLPVDRPSDVGGPFDLVVVRAFAAARIAIPAAAALCSAGGRVMWLHSANDSAAEREIPGVSRSASLPSGVASMLLTEFLITQTPD
jgi:16S rRNA (guanine527-N7)-methyltransferase